MQSKAYHKLIKNVSWRHVVVFLLLGIASFDLTVVDMISPQRCDDGFSAIADDISVWNAAGRSDQNAPDKVAIIDQPPLPQQDSGSGSSPASTDDDCFCCCSHVLPGSPVNHVTLNTMPRIDIPLIGSLPSAPTQDTFHPPRLV